MLPASTPILKPIQREPTWPYMSPETLTDQELLTLLHQGDKLAFETIYKRYASRLYNFARKNIGVSEDCKELIQEVFLSLWARRDKLSHVTSLRHYLFQSVRYMIIRYIQHSVVKRRYIDHYRIFEFMYEPAPETDILHRTTHETILKLIKKLPHRCQMAITLRLTENLSNGEIAIRMNVNKTTIENYMVVALKYLRNFQKEIYNSD